MNNAMNGENSVVSKSKVSKLMDYSVRYTSQILSQIVSKSVILNCFLNTLVTITW